MTHQPAVHFDDTEVAFSHKTDGELRMANLIFTLVSHPAISNLATGMAAAALRRGLPVKGLIRSTVFRHFCGGETVEESEKTIDLLNRFRIGTILDYSVEGAQTETGFEATTQEILHTFEEARKNKAVPFCVFKTTGLAPAPLLEKIQDGQKLTYEERQAWSRVEDRVNRICQRAYDYNVPVLIDAEETWLQNPIDQLARTMMRRYNGARAIVFTTIQFYRTDALQKLRNDFYDAAMHNYFYGIKMVRGAYMEKERERAAAAGYASPIHPTKEATDDCFNKGLAFCVDNKQRIAIICGSHNEYSNRYLTVLMEKHGLNPGDPRAWFAQLLGMSDHISFNLAKAGFSVAKYVPYGPVAAVMPYLIRRAQENTSVEGQSSRELALIRKELARRRTVKRK
jgi:proline dehydrogenase